MSPGEFKKAKTWDISHMEVELEWEALMVQIQAPLFEAGMVAFHFILELGSIVPHAQLNGDVLTQDEKNTIQTFLDHLKQFTTFASISTPQEMDLKDVEVLLKKIARRWHTQNTKIDRLVDEYEDFERDERNQNLGDMTIQAHVDGVKKVIGIAGSCHLKLYKKQPHWRQAVENLYKALDQRHIRYVTLKATNSIPETKRPFEGRELRSFKKSKAGCQ